MFSGRIATGRGCRLRRNRAATSISHALSPSRTRMTPSRLGRSSTVRFQQILESRGLRQLFPAWRVLELPSGRPALTTRHYRVDHTPPRPASTSSRVCVTYKMGIPFAAFPCAQIVHNRRFQFPRPIPSTARRAAIRAVQYHGSGHAILCLSPRTFRQLFIPYCKESFNCLYRCVFEILFNHRPSLRCSGKK